jgi:hypothetical protein
MYMKFAEFSLDIEPFSVNAMYSRDKRFKTSRYKQFEMDFIMQMRRPEIQAKLRECREYFDQDKHVYHVEMHFYFKGFYNKQGGLSARCEDLSNVEKPILDLLFLGKTHVQCAPWGCPNLNVDDKYVTRLVSEKREGPTRIDFKLAIMPR